MSVILLMITLVVPLARAGDIVWCLQCGSFCYSERVQDGNCMPIRDNLCDDKKSRRANRAACAGRRQVLYQASSELGTVLGTGYWTFAPKLDLEGCYVPGTFSTATEVPKGFGVGKRTGAFLYLLPVRTGLFHEDPEGIIRENCVLVAPPSESPEVKQAFDRFIQLRDSAGGTPSGLASSSGKVGPLGGFVPATGIFMSSGD